MTQLFWLCHDTALYCEWYTQESSGHSLGNHLAQGFSPQRQLYTNLIRAVVSRTVGVQTGEGCVPCWTQSQLVTLDQESSEYESSTPSPSPYNMSRQQQQGKTPSASTPHQTTEEQLLAMIAILQQQVNTMLLQQQGSRVEVIRPQVFSRKIEEVSVFVNIA